MIIIITIIIIIIIIIKITISVSEDATLIFNLSHRKVSEICQSVLF